MSSLVLLQSPILPLLRSPILHLFSNSSNGCLLTQLKLLRLWVSPSNRLLRTRLSSVVVRRSLQRQQLALWQLTKSNSSERFQLNQTNPLRSSKTQTHSNRQLKPKLSSLPNNSSSRPPLLSKLTLSQLLLRLIQFKEPWHRPLLLKLSPTPKPRMLPPNNLNSS